MSVHSPNGRKYQPQAKKPLKLGDWSRGCECGANGFHFSLFSSPQLREYQQKNSPGVPAGAKKKKKIKNGSSPERTTAHDCQSPGDVSLGCQIPGDGAEGRAVVQVSGAAGAV